MPRLECIVALAPLVPASNSAPVQAAGGFKPSRRVRVRLRVQLTIDLL